jgi:hypothetical protein
MMTKITENKLFGINQEMLIEKFLIGKFKIYEIQQNREWNRIIE